MASRDSAASPNRGSRASAGRPQRSGVASVPENSTADTEQPQRTWAYGELTVENIVAAALRIVRRSGVKALTMRGLASELGLSTMVLYYYIENKAALLTLISDAVAGSIEIPDPSTGPWDQRLRALVRNARDEYSKFPGLVQVLLDHEQTPNEMALGRAANELLLEGGIPGDDDALQLGTVALINFAFGTLLWNPALSKSGVNRNYPADEPALRFEASYSGDPNALFEFGLDLIVGALGERAKAPPGSAQ